ncbi:MAG: hypothetical protein AAB479_02595 [Patescibacteria group bacterium]
MNPRRDYKAALTLRLQGKTYGEIRDLFKIPKSTLSTWFKEIKLSSQAKLLLAQKTRNGYLELVKFNKQRTIKIEEENQSIRKKHESFVGKLSDRELMIVGAMLYWGEGYKNFGKKSYVHLCLANSDPELIKIFIVFLNKFMDIKPEDIKPQVLIYPNMNPREAVSYWNKVSGIPSSNFRCYIALSRASQRKRPRNLLPYGTLQLRVNSRQQFFKIRGLIDGVIKSIK